MGRKKGSRCGVHVGWEKPERGRLALNVDGSWCKGNREAGCAGVVRDHTGEWKGGYMAHVHVDTVVETEGWAIIKGIRWAWDKRMAEARCPKRLK